MTTYPFAYAHIVGGMPGYLGSTEYDAFAVETPEAVAEAVTAEIRHHFEPELDAVDTDMRDYGAFADDVDALCERVADEIDAHANLGDTTGNTLAWRLGCECPSDWVIQVTLYRTFDAMLHAVYGGDMEAVPEELLP